MRRMYRDRRAVSIENAHLRVTVVEGGGHIAEIADKRTNLNPLWTPPWPSIEPLSYDAARHPEYGGGVESRLLAGILGHNICLDVFGGPSPEEAAAGLDVHGEGPIVTYAIAGGGSALEMRAELPLAQLRFERTIALHDRAVRIRETIENIAAHDRPIAWTQHATLGPPFLEKGVTEFRASATRSQAGEGRFGDDDYLVAGAVFDWPHAPRSAGGVADLRRFNDAPASSAYTTHLMDPSREDAYFVAFSPRLQLAFGYVWRRADFPWMGIWEENLSRQGPPWHGKVLTRGMEFGVSPFAETRRQMIDRGRLFDTPGFRWAPAKSRIEAEYWAILEPAREIPTELRWPEKLHM
jgi:hypothetical protein